MARCGCGTAATPATPVAFTVAPMSGLTQKGGSGADDPLTLGTDPSVLSRGFRGSEVFKTAGTHPFRIGDYPDAKWVRVRAVGGGGGGAGATAVAGAGVARGGGSGGNYSESWISATVLPQNVTVTVGAGGAGGIGAEESSGDGGNGEHTSFGTFVLATGGLGAVALSPATDGPVIEPGAAVIDFEHTFGQIVAPGSAGERGTQIAPGVATGGMGGMGGDGLGTGGPGGTAGTLSKDAGADGFPFGGGGGGAAVLGTAARGGAGGPGGVIVEVFS